MFSLLDAQAAATIRGYLSQIASSSAWKMLRDVMAKGAKVAAEWAAKNKQYLFELITTGIQLGPEIYKLLQNIPFADIINPDIIGSIIAAASGDPALAAYLLDQGIREIKYELTQCFTAGTLVETDQGPVPIEEIEEGDYVLSLNFETGELEYSAVTETYVGETSELYLITAGDDVIEATYGHPFYVEEEGWIEAGELQAGYALAVSSGEAVRVEHVEVVYLEEPVLVYNIEVEGTHNYFVGGGLLVHNGCDMSMSPHSIERWHEGTFDSVEDSLEYHYITHGDEVKAKDIDHYVVKAQEFAKNLRGAHRSYPDEGTEGAIRYTKNGKYIIIAPDDRIISFGLERK